MIYHKYELVEAIAVWLYVGDSNSDEDWRKMVASIVKLKDLFVDRTAACLHIIEPGNPTPPPAWRREVANATTELKGGAVNAVISESILVRGAVTAINWLRPPPYETKFFGDFARAHAWLEQRRGIPLPGLPGLVEALRIEAGQRAG